MTAAKPSAAPKQQFILTTADGSGAGKVILASPDSHSTKQLIFAASDSIMPGRIQVERHCQSHRTELEDKQNHLYKGPAFDFQIVTDPVSMERLLGQTGDLSRGQLVEYCVVCGDKASGRTIRIAASSGVFDVATRAFASQGVTTARSAAKAARASSSEA